MARLSGVELQDTARLDYALTKLRGIGWALAGKILKDLSMDGSRRMSTITPDEISKISAKLEEFTIEGDLARKVKADIKRLQAINSFRGLRHSRGLPVRGQRTRSNGRTKRGKRKTVGAFKKDVLAKMTSAK